MSYGNVIMSSGWDMLLFLSHPDEIANYDFPQHAVALQRFRTSSAQWQWGTNNQAAILEKVFLNAFSLKKIPIRISIKFVILTIPLNIVLVMICRLFAAKPLTMVIQFSDVYIDGLV